MGSSFYPVLEHPVAGFSDYAGSGKALARVVEAHPALTPLLDFCAVDPREIALAVGMVYPYEEDGTDDLEEIDFGPGEWHESSAGLIVVRQALQVVRDDPQSLAAAIYDPTLQAAEVVADLERIEAALLLAQQYETRFHFVMDA